MVRTKAVKKASASNKPPESHTRRRSRRAQDIVRLIESDIDRRSGLSPMIWADRTMRDAVLASWVQIIERILVS